MTDKDDEKEVVVIVEPEDDIDPCCEDPESCPCSK